MITDPGLLAILAPVGLWLPIALAAERCRLLADVAQGCLFKVVSVIGGHVQGPNVIHLVLEVPSSLKYVFQEFPNRVVSPVCRCLINF